MLSSGAPTNPAARCSLIHAADFMFTPSKIGTRPDRVNAHHMIVFEHVEHRQRNYRSKLDGIEKTLCPNSKPTSGSASISSRANASTDRATPRCVTAPAPFLLHEP